MSKKNPTTIKAEPGKQEIFITREFDAPRDLVWKAHTDPEIMKNWLGPRELRIRIEKFEPFTGGSYRYILSDKKGNEFGFRGVIPESIAPKLSIQTFEFEGIPEKGHVVLETSRFESLPGNRTRLFFHAPASKSCRCGFLLASHDLAQLQLAINEQMYIADRSEQAADEFWPINEKMMNRFGREGMQVAPAVRKRIA